MDIWRELVSIARYAPSPHNTQPWLLKPRDSTSAVLSMVRSRMLPDEDLTGSFLCCAMGIFIESLRIVAANRGLRLECEPIELDRTSSSELIPFSHLILHLDSSVQAMYSDEAFLSRRTSRLRPTGQRITAEIVEEIRATAAKWDQSFHVIDDQEQIDAILDRNIDAVFEDLNLKPYHDEIVSWFRYGYAHERNTCDGLASRCMNMTAAELFFTARFPGLLVNPLTRKFMHALYDWRLGTALHLGVLDGPFWDRHSSERAGRGLLHLWVRLATHKIFIHPFGNLVTNAPARAWLESFTGLERIWLVFRMGHTADPPQSFRLPTERLIAE
jgi:hypothetical protein